MTELIIMTYILGFAAGAIFAALVGLAIFDFDE
nr:MAG TPA: YtxH-like protein [Caudoviricetes sp.]